MIVVIDYDVGNVRSVCNAFEYIGCDVKLSAQASEIRKAAGLVLPGVAAFGYATQALGKLGPVIKQAADSGTPLLGICVGYQLLFEKSLEHGTHQGLGLIKGKVISIPQGRVIPHMGWNQVRLDKTLKLFQGLGDQKYFYFAHSYYAQVQDPQAQVAYTDYGIGLPAAVWKNNVYGCQFHPEKSGPQGLKILENFSRISHGD